MRPLAPVPLVLVACAGCGPGGRGGRDGGDDALDAIPRAFVGALEIGETEEDSFGVTPFVFGKFELELPGAPDLANDGTCRVYEDPCIVGQSGACDGPDAHSAGAITITGLATPVDLLSDPVNHIYWSPTGLPEDLFTDDATVIAEATGDEVPGFSLTVMGVEPLVSGYIDQRIGLVPGQPLELTWTAGTSGASIQLRAVWANDCFTGAERHVLECEVTDSGELTVTAAITGVLPSAGFATCGARLARFRRSVVPGGALALVIRSSDVFLDSP